MSTTAPESSGSPPATKKTGDLAARFVTAIILAPLLIAMALVGPNLLIWLIVTVAAGIGNLEFTRMMVSATGARAVRAASLLGTVGVLSAGYWTGSSEAVVGGMAAALVFTLFVELATVKDVRESARRLGGAISGMVYASLLFGSVLYLAASDDPFSVSPGQAGWFLFPMFVVWMGDTGAYFAGRAFGRHKLAPLVSPGKSWEGALGGALASVAGGYICWWVLLPDAGIEVWHVLLFALPGAILGQFGDLFESLIKRSTGFKDSGRILHGHGGMLDRVDGLLLAAPWFVLLKVWLGL